MQLEDKIINWYEKNKRQFPWRETKNPYYIWICEIMSQQTQITRVIDYYQRFLRIFPTLTDLAHASETDLLKAWEGLGYYSRVRNMKIAANQVLIDFAGIFPNNYHDLLKLKGIGSYTAAAIASIVFAEPVAAVDGNVLRVVTRLYEIDDDILAQKTKHNIKTLLETEMTTKQPSSFNQGLIELGACVCLPQNPRCLICPLQNNCLAYQHKTTNHYPYKKKKTKPDEEQYYTFVLSDKTEKIYLIKEQEKQFLHGLFALPQYKHEDNLVEVLEKLKTDTGCTFTVDAVQFKQNYKHIFSHKIWLMETYVIRVEQTNTNFHDIAVVPLANAHRKVIK